MNLPDKLILACGDVELAAEIHDAVLLGLYHRDVFTFDHSQLFPPDIVICGVPDISYAEIPRPIHEIVRRHGGLRRHLMFHTEGDLIFVVYQRGVEMNGIRLFP